MSNPLQTPDGGAPQTLASIVGGIARDIDDGLSSGDVAELRRARPDSVPGPAFWRIVATHAITTESEGSARLEAERRWTAIVSGMAKMKGLHRPAARLGRALAQGGLTEPRVLRLLRAHDEALADVVRTTAHQLASTATPVDWTDLARLVLSDGRSDEDEVRRRIARDYYSQDARDR